MGILPEHAYLRLIHALVQELLLAVADMIRGAVALVAAHGAPVAEPVTRLRKHMLRVSPKGVSYGRGGAEPTWPLDAVRLSGSPLWEDFAHEPWQFLPFSQKVIAHISPVCFSSHG